MERGGHAEAGQKVKYGFEEDREFGRGHLPGSHRKFRMYLLAEARDVSGDSHIVGRIRENSLRPAAAKQGVIALPLHGIAAQQEMVANLPEVAGVRYGGA